MQQTSKKMVCQQTQKSRLIRSRINRQTWRVNKLEPYPHHPHIANFTEQPWKLTCEPTQTSFFLKMFLFNITFVCLPIVHPTFHGCIPHLSSWMPKQMCVLNFPYLLVISQFAMENHRTQWAIFLTQRSLLEQTKIGAGLAYCLLSSTSWCVKAGTPTISSTNQEWALRTSIHHKILLI